MRKDTRLSLLFRTASDRELGRAWEQGYTAILPAVLLIFLSVLVVVLSTSDSFSLSPLSDLESIVREVSTIQRFRMVEVILL